MTSTRSSADPQGSRNRAVAPTPHPRGEGWADRSKLSENSREFRKKLVIAAALLILLVAAEAVLLTTVANILIAGSVWLSWLLVCGLCTAIVCSAVFGGQQLRYAMATGKRIYWAFAGALLFAWIGLGVMLMVVRMNSGVLENTDVAFEYSGMTVDDTASSSHHWLAFLMLSLHIVIGILAVYDGYRFTNPVATDYRRLQTQLATREAALAVKESDFVRSAELYRIAQSEQQRIEADFGEACKHADTVFDQLQASVRLHIASLLGDPGSTSGARQRPTPVHY